VFTANLTSEAESDIRPREQKKRAAAEKPAGPEAAAAPAPAPEPAKIENAHSEWGAWLAVLAAGLVAFDVFWLTRKQRAPRVVASTAGMMARVSPPHPRSGLPPRGP
jgi:hypothetical protein